MGTQSLVLEQKTTKIVSPLLVKCIKIISSHTLHYSTQHKTYKQHIFVLKLTCLWVTNTEVFLMCIYTKSPKHEMVFRLCFQNLGSKTQKKL